MPGMFDFRRVTGEPNMDLLPRIASGSRFFDLLERAGCAMSLASCCVVQSQNEAATDADTTADFLSKFRSKHAEVAKLVAEERLGGCLAAARFLYGKAHVTDTDRLKCCEVQADPAISSSKHQQLSTALRTPDECVALGGSFSTGSR